MSMNYFAISNDELNEKSSLSDTVKCKICGEYHSIEYGDKINKDGSKTKSTMLAYVKCPKDGECYLVGINGKAI